PARFSATAVPQTSLNAMPHSGPPARAPPVALASPGGDFIYTDILLPCHAINNAGNMVGFARNADFSAERAVFWASSSSPAVILSTVGEFTNAVATGISDNGQIVGSASNEDFSKERPFLW